MNKIADFLVKRRYIVLIIMLVISVFCAFLIPSVEINADMTKYLPDNSSMQPWHKYFYGKHFEHYIFNRRYIAACPFDGLFYNPYEQIPPGKGFGI